MTSGIAERAERVQQSRRPAPPGEPRQEAVLRSGLCDIEAIRSWASAAEGRIVSELAAVTAMPEASIAEATREVKAIQRDDGRERLERQRRATSMSTWTDDDGMWNLRAKFDPLTGVKLSNAIDRGLNALFAETVPESCPADPVEKQKHLRALASGVCCGRCTARVRFQDVRRTSIVARSTTSSGGATEG